MKRYALPFLGALLAATPLAAAADSFSLAGVGARVGYVNPESLHGTTHYGLHTEFARPSSRFSLMPSGFAWTARGNTSLNLNLDACYRLTTQSLSTPYVGVGVGAFQRRVDAETSETAAGFNLFGGFLFPSTEGRYYVEARYAATEFGQLSVLGGATFHLPD
jgi:hypothetical protein